MALLWTSSQQRNIIVQEAQNCIFRFITYICNTGTRHKRVWLSQTLLFPADVVGNIAHPIHRWPEVAVAVSHGRQSPELACWNPRAIGCWKKRFNNFFLHYHLPHSSQLVTSGKTSLRAPLILVSSMGQSKATSEAKSKSKARAIAVRERGSMKSFILTERLCLVLYLLWRCRTYTIFFVDFVTWTLEEFLHKHQLDMCYIQLAKNQHKQ